jgi:hypothetical protein
MEASPENGKMMITSIYVSWGLMAVEYGEKMLA